MSHGCMASSGSSSRVEQARHRSGAAHAMPVVAHAPGEQADRQIGIRHIGGRACWIGTKRALPSAVGKTPSAYRTVPPAATGPGRIRPLLGPSGRAGVAQAGDVQIATARAFPVLVENRLGIGVGKQPFAIAVQPDRQATAKSTTISQSWRASPGDGTAE